MSNKLKNNPRRSISFEKKKKMKVEKNTVLPCFRDNDPPFQAKIKKLIRSYHFQIEFHLYFIQVQGPRPLRPQAAAGAPQPYRPQQAYPQRQVGMNLV